MNIEWDDLHATIEDSVFWDDVEGVTVSIDIVGETEDTNIYRSEYEWMWKVRVYGEMTILEESLPSYDTIEEAKQAFEEYWDWRTDGYKGPFSIVDEREGVGEETFKQLINAKEYACKASFADKNCSFHVLGKWSSQPLYIYHNGYSYCLDSVR
jgi:hypothetical protein